jgi:hypothetical protein
MRTIFALLLLCSIICQAQDAGTVRCRFLSLQSVEAPPDLINLSAKGVQVPCKVPVNKLSEETVFFTKGGTILFLFASDQKPAATAKIPANLKSAILVFLPKPKETAGLPWRIFVIDDSAKNFPFGGALVANLHRGDIAFTVGEHKIKLHPGTSHGLARPTVLDDFNMAPVSFQFQQQDTWRIASESKLRFVPAIRYLIFAYLDPSSGRPRLSTLQDFKPLPAPKVN